MDLKMFRKTHKLSQRDLAELFDCSVGHISNIESGTRSLTGLQVRLLIDEFGYNDVAKFADASDLPSGSPASVNVDMSKTEIKGNTAPVQNGDGNQMSTDSALVQVVKQQSDQISKLIEQQERLISLLEKK